jgi:hypothetical protein
MGKKKKKISAKKVMTKFIAAIGAIAILASVASMFFL